MDPVSQGALGAAFAGSAAGRQRLAIAGVLGGLGGMAPDLDVLIRSSTDPLLALEYHRQFTHALVFVPIGAFLVALVLHPFVRRRMRFRETWRCCGLGYVTHGLLDACTSYGTQLFWPFSDERVAWNYVAVVDPLLTVPLVVLVVAALLRNRRAYALAGLCWAVLYLGAGALQGARAEEAARTLARECGHRAEQLTVKPSFGNILVWKSIYLADGRYYVDAIRAGATVTRIPGSSVPALDVVRDLPWLDPSSRQARDLERFRWFSGGYVALDPRTPDKVVDVRYSMVPNEIDALWGIVLNPAAGSAEPVAFVVDRRADAAHRAALWRLLRGAGSAATE